MIGFMIVNRQLKKERTHMFVVEFEGDLKKKKKGAIWFNLS